MGISKVLSDGFICAFQDLPQLSAVTISHNAAIITDKNKQQQNITAVRFCCWLFLFVMIAALWEMVTAVVVKISE